MLFSAPLQFRRGTASGPADASRYPCLRVRQRHAVDRPYPGPRCVRADPHSCALLWIPRADTAPASDAAKLHRRRTLSPTAALRSSSIEDLIEYPVVDLMHQRLAMGEPARWRIGAVEAFVLTFRGEDVLIDRHIPATEVVLDHLLEIGPLNTVLREQGAMDHPRPAGAERMHLQVPGAIDRAGKISAGIDQRRIGAARLPPARQAFDGGKALGA